MLSHVASRSVRRPPSINHLLRTTTCNDAPARPRWEVPICKLHVRGTAGACWSRQAPHRDPFDRSILERADHRYLVFGDLDESRPREVGAARIAHEHLRAG